MDLIFKFYVTDKFKKATNQLPVEWRKEFRIPERQENSECNSPLEGASAAFNAIFSEQEVDLLPADSEEVPPPCSAVPRRDSQTYQPITARLT